MKNFRPKYLKLISIMLTSLITMQTCIAIESPEWLNNLKITIVDSYFNHPKTTIAVAATGSLAVVSASTYAAKKLLTKPVKLSNFEKIKKAACSKRSLYSIASVVGIAGVAGLLFWYFKKPAPVILEPVIPAPVIPTSVIPAPVVKKTYIQRPLSIPELPIVKEYPIQAISEQQTKFKEISKLRQNFSYSSFFDKNNQEFLSINIPESLFEFLQKNDAIINLLSDKTGIYYAKNNGTVNIIIPKNKYDKFLEEIETLKFFALERKKEESNISTETQINLNNEIKKQKSIEEINKEMVDKAIQNLKKIHNNKQTARKAIQNLIKSKPTKPSKNNRLPVGDAQEEARKKRALQKVKNIGKRTPLADILEKIGSQSAPTPEIPKKKANPLDDSEI